MRVVSVLSCLLAAVALGSCSLEYEYIIIGPHHKTGTIQSQCMMYAWAKSHDWAFAAGKMTPHSNIWYEVPKALKETETYALTRQLDLPFVIGTWKARHHCTETGCPEGSLVTCPPGSTDCDITIKTARVLHTYRNPISTLLSSHAYHTQPKIPDMEGWLSYDAMHMASQQADAAQFARDFITKLNREEHVGMSLHELLLELPFEKSLTLNFLIGFRELQEAALLLKFTKNSPNILHVRFEDLSLNYNHTAGRIYDFFKVNATESLLPRDVYVSSVQPCDPNTWSKKEISASDHLTGGSKRSFTTEEAVEILKGNEELWTAMCDLCKNLEYTDGGCEHCS